ncbi:plasmid pRiA4b ORF-3 family protein [Maritimibacter sp. 55A14]|uniref:plasmid pRiA4b ORF-3 family protein n=1 Tax=Maritimibacter sp. 55A14 TaxID=2174844 RepID=UPI0018EE9121|nr:plasmid pRiA4b ORF-3 family protein [Maritimibacter sp. 55A14]
MFEARGATWGLPDPNVGGSDLPAKKTTLAELIEDTGARTISYLYDFGDSWDHKIRVGKISDPVPGKLYPRLTDISGRCPPDDVGGFPGYEEFLEAMADPKHPEHADSSDGTAVTSIPTLQTATNSASKSTNLPNAGSRRNGQSTDQRGLSASLTFCLGAFASWSYDWLA